MNLLRVRSITQVQKVKQANSQNQKGKKSKTREIIIEDQRRCRAAWVIIAQMLVLTQENDQHVKRGIDPSSPMPVFPGRLAKLSKTVQTSLTDIGKVDERGRRTETNSVADF